MLLSKNGTLAYSAIPINFIISIQISFGTQVSKSWNITLDNFGLLSKFNEWLKVWSNFLN